jgi:hypothetical protein
MAYIIDRDSKTVLECIPSTVYAQVSTTQPTERVGEMTPYPGWPKKFYMIDRDGKTVLTCRRSTDPEQVLVTHPMERIGEMFPLQGRVIFEVAPAKNAFMTQDAEGFWTYAGEPVCRPPEPRGGPASG